MSRPPTPLDRAELPPGPRQAERDAATVDALVDLVAQAAEVYEQANRRGGPTQAWTRDTKRAIGKALYLALDRVPTQAELERVDDALG